MDYLRKNYNMSIKYALPSEYFESVMKSANEKTFHTYEGDFFPYADNYNDYWSVRIFNKSIYCKLRAIIQQIHF